MNNPKLTKIWSRSLEKKEEKIIILVLILGKFLLPVNSGLHLSSNGVSIMWLDSYANQQELPGFLNEKKRPDAFYFFSVKMEKTKYDQAMIHMESYVCCVIEL